MTAARVQAMARGVPRSPPPNVLDVRFACYCRPHLSQHEGREAMATWSLCGRHAGPDKSPTPVFINLDNVLTVERQGDLTTVIMVGGEKVCIDTMPETLIGAVAPAGPL
jgi:hypothetical protein